MRSPHPAVQAPRPELPPETERHLLPIDREIPPEDINWPALRRAQAARDERKERR